MRVKRSEVIKALRTEPLGAQGEYWEPYNNRSGCRVCAVGAIVRRALGDKYAEDFTLLGLYDDTKSERLLWSLSHFYEDKMHTRTSPIDKRFRETLVNFVKKNFPAEIEVPA